MTAAVSIRARPIEPRLKRSKLLTTYPKGRRCALGLCGCDAPGSGPSASRGKRLIDQHGGERAALFATHPDQGGNAEDFADVQAARAELVA